MVKDIVAKLEDRFDDYDRRTLSMTSSIGREVQGLAMTTTLNEIPHIKLVGTETGVFTGFGNSIYLDSNQELQDSVSIRCDIEFISMILACFVSKQNRFFMSTYH